MSSSVRRSGIKTYARYLNTLAGATQVFPTTGNFDLLETVVLSSTATSITFSNVTSYASTYQHLQIRLVNFSGQANFGRININSNTGVNSHFLRGRAGAVGSAANGASSDYLYYIGSTSNPGFAVIDLLDAFESGKNKTARAFTGLMESTPEVSTTSALWTITDPISSITIPHPNSFNFSIGSRFSLYGVR